MSPKEEVLRILIALGILLGGGRFPLLGAEGRPRRPGGGPFLAGQMACLGDRIGFPPISERLGRLIERTDVAGRDLPRWRAE
jgi:hypothetical protein